MSLFSPPLNFHSARVKCFFPSSSPACTSFRARRPRSHPRRKTRRDFHSIVPRPSCAWPGRVALGTGITIIRSLPRSLSRRQVRNENEEQEEDERARRYSPAHPLWSPRSAPFRLFSAVYNWESGRKTKNRNARKKTPHIQRRLLPSPYRNTLFRRFVSIVYSGDRESEREGRAG